MRGDFDPYVPALDAAGVVDPFERFAPGAGAVLVAAIVKDGAVAAVNPDG